MFKLIKFSSPTCGMCGRAAQYDSNAATDLGIPFIEARTDDKATYFKWVYLLKDLPQIGYPTYFLLDGQGNPLGTILGAMPAGEFKKRLKNLLPALSATVPNS